MGMGSIDDRLWSGEEGLSVRPAIVDGRAGGVSAFR